MNVLRITLLMGLLPLLSCGTGDVEHDHVEIDAAPLMVQQDTICNVDEGAEFFKRTEAQNGGKNLDSLLILKSRVTSGSVAEAYVYYQIGRCYSRQGQKDSSVNYYQFALAGFTEGDTVVVEQSARLCLNLSSAAENNVSESLAYAHQGLELMLSRIGECSWGRPQLLGWLANNAAMSSLDLDDAAGALENAKFGLNNCCPEKFRRLQIVLRNTLAQAFLEVGDTLAAMQNLKLAEEQFAGFNNVIPKEETDLANTYDRWQMLAEDLGNETLFRERAKRALDIRRKHAPGGENEAHSLNNYGRILLLSGKTAEGERHIHKALGLYRSLPSLRGMGTAFESLSLAELRQGDTLAALNYLDSARLAYHGRPEYPGLDYARDKSELRDPLVTRARILAGRHITSPDVVPLGEVEQALADVDSLDVFLRHRVRSERSKRTIIHQTRELYESVVDGFARQYERTGDPKYQTLAVRYLDRAKASVLAERRARMVQHGAETGKKSLREKDMEDKIVKLRKALRGRPDSISLERELHRAEYRLHQLREKAYAATTSLVGSTVHEDALGEVLPTLDEGTVVLDYFLGKEKVFVVVGAKDSVRLLTLAVAPAALSERILTYRRAISAQSSRKWRGDRALQTATFATLRQEGFALYRDLIAPAFPDGKLPDRLVLIPDGPLHTLPFTALLTDAATTEEPDGWPFLVRSTVVNHQFSARLWAEQLADDRPRGTRKLVIAPKQQRLHNSVTPLGDTIFLPALPYSEAEVAAVAQLPGYEKTWPGAEAGRLARQPDLSRYGIVHFTGHGIPQPRDPEASFLALHVTADVDPVVLTVADLARQPLNAELLVLSACGTHDGKVDRAEGTLSLARAGLIAGARSVVSSLWPVPQQDKAALFYHYYRFLAQGMRRDEALAEAQRAFIRDNPFQANPLYWAAFVNIGEGEELPAQLLK